MMMKDSHIYNMVRQWAVLLLLVLLPWAAYAEPRQKYTAAHPLIITGDDEMPPYSFSNTSGRSIGHNVDMLDLVLSRMDIPHEFVLKDWDAAAEMFENHEADLIIDPLGRYKSGNGYGSRSSLAYYKFVVAVRKAEAHPFTIEDLQEADGLVVKEHDSDMQRLIQGYAPNKTIWEAAPRDALAGLLTEKYNCFIWSEEPLKWMLKELGLNSDIALCDINIPAGDVLFVGHDKALVDFIDDQLARLMQRGELEQIHDKWLHPERKHNNTSHVAVYITLAILLIAVVLIVTNRLIRQRIRLATQKVTEVEAMMRHALSMGNIFVLEYNVGIDLFTNRHGIGIPREGYTMQQFLQHIHPDDQKAVVQEVEKLLNGSNPICEVNRRWNKGGLEHPEWVFVHGYAITEQDDFGRTSFIVLAIKNVTDAFEEQRNDEEMGTKYAKMFDSTLVAMSFYDANGVLIDLNQNMKALCNFDALGEKYFRETNLFDSPMFKGDLDRHGREGFHACQHMNYPEMGIDKYIELRVLPTYDNDELQHFIITARDVTAERSMYNALGRQDAELRRTGETVNRYEQELHYLLENSNMWVWRSSLKERRIYLSRSLRSDEYSHTFEEYLDYIDPRCREDAFQLFGEMKGVEHNISAVHLFRNTPVNPKPHWCASNGIPIYGADGKLEGHFGVVRDVTELMEAQERLRQETARAKDSGRLKSVFLANMTHEIRTPLNAIVGFSDLLQMIDDPGERHDFIRIIRNNCDMLIRLINDIIEASSLGQGPLAIEAEDVDFAEAFNDICQTLAQRVQEPGVEFIVDNPYTSFLTYVDKGRLQQVITNFTTNAVKYTHKGHIRVGYRYMGIDELARAAGRLFDAPDTQKGIYMYCEDTGVGIPKDQQEAVFERFVKLNDFVQGTGLGLSICKSIADRCGGYIGVISEGEDCGSTFWIWIPCPRISSNPDSSS